MRIYLDILGKKQMVDNILAHKVNSYNYKTTVSSPRVDLKVCP